MIKLRNLFWFLALLLVFPETGVAQQADEFSIEEVEEPKDSRARRRKRRERRRQARKRQRDKRRAKREKKAAPPRVVKKKQKKPVAKKTSSSDARLKFLRQKYAARRWPTAINDRPLVLARSLLEVRGDTVFVSLANGFESEPIAFMPRLYYGVTDEFTVGLIHGDLAALAALSGAGGLGICVGGTNCPRSSAYNDIGLDALYDLGSIGGVELAAHGGLVAASFDPFALALNVGALARWRKDKLAIVVDPRLRLGLTARSMDVVMSTVPFNREVLSIPITAHYQLREKLNVFARTGFFATLSGVGDTFAIPLGAGATYSLTDSIDVGGELTMWLASGGFNAGEFRYVLFRFAYRLPLG